MNLNKLVSILALCTSAITAAAQSKADINVSYDCVRPNKKDQPVTSKMSLLVNPTEAKYFNDLSLWVDSLKSTPEGKAQYKEILKKACLTIEPDGGFTWDLSKGPSKVVYTYVFTNLNDGMLTHYGMYGEDLGYYTEPIDEMNWSIAEDSTAAILGYECIMAECDYHGRHWKAWFAPEIPMSFGPWKLRALPGLILKAEANGGFSFTATAIERSDRLITPMYLKEDYAKVDRKKALGDAEYYMNNQESIMNAQGQNVRVYTLDVNGNEVEVPKYDGLKHSIEPDYKMK